MKNIILKLLKEYTNEDNINQNNTEDGKIITVLIENNNLDYVFVLKKNNFNLSHFWKIKLKKFDQIKNKALYLEKEIFSLNSKYDEEKLKYLSEELKDLNKLTARVVIYYLIKEFDFGNFYPYFENISNENSKYFLLDCLGLMEEKYFPISLEEKIEKLEKYIKELRSSLELITFEKERLEEERTIEKENLKAELEKEFFSSLNSNENNYFIDNFKISQLKLKTLNKENYKIPEELDSIIITLKSFSKFLKKNKVKEIIGIGEIFEIDFHESFKYTYYGSEFLNENDKKIVKSETSGWKYEENIISKPIVREVIENGR